MSETTTKTTTKSVSFEVDGDITLLIKRWVMRWINQGGSDEGKSLLLFFLATFSKESWRITRRFCDRRRFNPKNRLRQ